jgi:hypothetical protein
VGEIKAIETEYRGCRFRSRLEARWAVFFDSLGWDWQYEKEGYILGWEGNDNLPWLPDFEVTTSPHHEASMSFYAEVKGDPNFFADGSWLGRLDFGGGPPGFAHSWYRDSPTCKPIVLLGNIPKFDGSTGDCPVFEVPTIVHKEGVHGYMSEVTRHCIDFSPDNNDFFWDNIQRGNGIHTFQVSALPSRYDGHKCGDPDVVAAVRAALGARFEHGEKGVR